MSTTTKFTPGPWAVSFDQIYAVDQSTNAYVVAQVCNWDDLGFGAANANAALIAAAPDYDAAARKLLAWAERAMPATDDAADFLNGDGWDEAAEIVADFRAALAKAREEHA